MLTNPYTNSADVFSPDSGQYILPYTTPLGGIGNRKNFFQKEGKEKTKNSRNFDVNYHIYT